MMYGKNNAARRYPKQKLDETWKKLLFNQSHDILAGTTIANVYNDAQRSYEDVKTTCNEIIEHCVQGITSPVKIRKSEFQFVLFNPLGWVRHEYVEIIVKSNEKYFSIEDASGNAIPHQVGGRTKAGLLLLCYIENIPAFGSKQIIVRAQKNKPEPFEQWAASSNKIETPFYRIHLDSRGALKSLYAKHLRRELIQKGKPGNFFATFRDVPKQWEAWSIDADYEKHRLDLWKLKQVKIVEQGPLRATIRLELKTENGSILLQDIHFYHRSPRIDFRTNLRWQEKQVLMKVAFPLSIKKPNAAYEIQFGAINRTSKPHKDEDVAKFEVPAQQWADLSDPKYGVSLINDCKYGYSAKENILQLTLMRSPRYPNPIDPSHCDEAFIDQGDHSFCYSLFPHHGDWAKGGTVQKAYESNHAILVFKNLIMDTIPSLIECSKQNIIVDAVKKAEDSDALIFRMHEASGISTDAVLRFGVPAANAVECDLLENEEKTMKIAKSKLSLKFRPFEIKTLKVQVKPVKKSHS
jgi:alpha-mannosidase